MSLDMQTQSLHEEFSVEIQGMWLHMQEVKTLVETIMGELKMQLAEVKTLAWHRGRRNTATCA
jgi:hypothetical protein